MLNVPKPKHIISKSKKLTNNPPTIGPKTSPMNILNPMIPEIASPS